MTGPAGYHPPQYDAATLPEPLLPGDTLVIGRTEITMNGAHR